LLAALLGKNCQRGADGLAASADAADSLGLLRPQLGDFRLLRGFLLCLLPLHCNQLRPLSSSCSLPLTRDALHLCSSPPRLFVSLRLPALGLLVGVVLLSACVT
jgi:hypothetical protein